MENIALIAPDHTTVAAEMALVAATASVPSFDTRSVVAWPTTTPKTSVPTSGAACRKNSTVRARVCTSTPAAARTANTTATSRRRRNRTPPTARGSRAGTETALRRRRPSSAAPVRHGPEHVPPCVLARERADCGVEPEPEERVLHEEEPDERRRHRHREPEDALLQPDARDALRARARGLPTQRVQDLVERQRRDDEERREHVAQRRRGEVVAGRVFPSFVVTDHDRVRGRHGHAAEVAHEHGPPERPYRAELSRVVVRHVLRVVVVVVVVVRHVLRVVVVVVGGGGVVVDVDDVRVSRDPEQRRGERRGFVVLAVVVVRARLLERDALRLSRADLVPLLLLLLLLRAQQRRFEVVVLARTGWRRRRRRRRRRGAPAAAPSPHDVPSSRVPRAAPD
eukprot:30706-Pelagococcus_subviridis.AAC.17